MNLVLRGTTASRANRGKSVKESIAQSNGCNSYERNGCWPAGFRKISFAVYLENQATAHLTE